MDGMGDTVHVLHEGFTLCGYGKGMFPGEWPGGHKWTYLHDLKNVTCEGCLEAAKKGDEKKCRTD